MSHLTHILGRLLQRHDLIWPLLSLVLSFVVTNGRRLRRRLTINTARNWPTLSAKVEIVTAVEQVREDRDGGETTGYLATLTYFYRNPDLQVGEYVRAFPLRAAAQQWADQFKDRQVLVHVSPKDPTDSVLLDADLDGLAPAASPTLEQALQMENLPPLSPGLLVLNSVSQMVAFTGFALTAVALVISFRSGSVPWPLWVFWTLGAMIVFNLFCSWLIAFQAQDSHSLAAALRVSSLWCPAWMRWGVKLSGGLLAVLWFLFAIQPELPTGLQHQLVRLVPQCIWLLACWGFLGAAALHTGIQRAQETVPPGFGSDSLPARPSVAD